ncbi:MAG TPA: glycosyltransferase family 4 protein [Acetobacteraceae bacterium]|nr:glycosyltransferase family 4 protein [Acetobacteraceae bacterium]
MRNRRNACLIVTNNFPPAIGGAGEVYAALAAGAAGRIRILCASSSYLTGEAIGGWRDHDRAVAYAVDRVAEIRGRLRRQRGRLAALLADEVPLRLRLLARVAWLRLRHGCRVLCIADDETVGWLIRPAQCLLACRVVLYSHGDDLAERPGEERLRARRRRQFARADAVVAVSTACARELGRVFGVPRDRVTVIHNGIDTALFRPLPPDPGLQEKLGLRNRRTIITISRLVARKGIDRVIEALPRILLAVPDLHYLVVGDGPQAAELRALAVRCGIAERVSFVGAVPHAEVPRYLALAELMAMPNRRMPDGEDDGLSLIFLEANACGLPVIGGRSGGAPEVVEDGVNGLLADGGDAASIAAAVTRLLCDADLAARLAGNGVQRAAQAGWAQRSAEFIALCERVAGGAGR